MRNPTKLNPKQEEFLALFVAGKSEKAICRKMKINKGGINYHLKHIFEVEGFTSRNQLLSAKLLHDKTFVQRLGMKLSRTQVSILKLIHNGVTGPIQASTLIFKQVDTVSKNNGVIFKKYGVKNMRELIFVLAGRECER